jgi:hypothetical protein
MGTPDVRGFARLLGESELRFLNDRNLFFRAEDEIEIFLSSDLLKKWASKTRVDLGRKGALNDSVAERTGDRPANTTGIEPFVYTVKLVFGNRRANPEIFNLVAPRFTPAVFDFPAVLLCRHVVLKFQSWFTQIIGLKSWRFSQNVSCCRTIN